VITPGGGPAASNSCMVSTRATVCCREDSTTTVAHQRGAVGRFRLAAIAVKLNGVIASEALKRRLVGAVSHTRGGADRLLRQDLP